MNEPETIRAMLGTTTSAHPRTIAVIGLSEDPTKPSHYVSASMQQRGYKIYPVNPSIREILYPSNPTSSMSSVYPNSSPPSSMR